MEDQAIPGVHSDEELVLLARAGDRGAFAELWQRHARSGMRVARQFTSSIDADDLVSEAYVRIYQRVLAGGGPDGAFRPYLYTTIRNIASRWGKQSRTVNVDDIGEFEDPEPYTDPVTVALDRTLTVRAFRSLPERWQTVLWYTEVEGMDPHEVAPIMAITANSVAALSYRAREGLRKAWLQAHITDAATSGECQWALARVGESARHALTEREQVRFDAHLAGCAKCTIVHSEVDEVGSHLAMVMLPLILGAGVGGALLATIAGHTGAAVAATAAGVIAAPGAAAAPGATFAATTAAPALSVPAMPPAFATAASAGAVAAPAVATGLTASAILAPLVGTLAVAMAVAGGLAVTAAVPQPTPPISTSIAEPLAGAVPASNISGGSGGSVTNPLLPSPLPTTGVNGVLAGAQGTVNGVVSGLGTTVDGLVNTLTNPINGLVPGLNVGPGPVPTETAPPGLVGTSVSLDLSGRGMPGATVAIQAANTVYATTKVTPQGTWAVHISALPNGVGSLQVKQTLLSLLGIDLVTVPLQVLSNSLGITLNVLGL